MWQQLKAEKMGDVIKAEFNGSAKDKTIRFAYESMSAHLDALQQNFYGNGQTDKDLKLMTDFREKLQKMEELMRDTMR
jgi:hypothetical protein